MFTNLKRIIKFAADDFSRNKGISVAAVFVLVVAILAVSCLFFFQGMTSYLTDEIQSKIDITAYFKEGVAEEEILAAKEQITLMPGIKNIEYISREQALEEFNERHQDNPVLARALIEVGDNPFLPSLNITTAGDPGQYKQISDALQESEFSAQLEKVDFSQKKDTIEKVYSITSRINRFGIILEIVLALVAMLVVFNTLKLAIENSKEEITTMRIVGASDWFIRGPFVVQGIIYGLVGFGICMALILIGSYLMTPYALTVMPGFNMFRYLLTNLWIFALIQLSFGVGVGVISSAIAIKKHLKV